MTTNSTKQIGGNHYTEPGTIQPWEIIEKNNLDYWAGNVIKYILRAEKKHTDPALQLEDYEKGRHYLDYLIERKRKQYEASQGNSSRNQ